MTNQPPAARNSTTASIYLRLSREAGTDQTGLTSQEADLRALAREHGLAIVSLHVDNGQSGDKRDRAAYLAWLADGRAGHTLLAYHLDRVSRGGLAGIAGFLDVVEGRVGDRRVPGTRFLSCSDRLDSDSPDWTIRVAVMSGLAAAERQRIGERSRRAHAQRRTEGRWSGGVAPVGFRTVPNPDESVGGKVLQIHPEEAANLREAIRMITTGGTLGQASRWLNVNGPLPRGKSGAWSRTTLVQAFKGEAFQTLLLSAADRRALQAVLDKNSAAYAGSLTSAPRKPSRLLSGVLRCSGCGSRMHVTSMTDRVGLAKVPVRRIYYRCSRGARAMGASLGCSRPVNMAAESAEVAVEAAWLGGWGPLAETIVERHSDVVANEIAAAEDEVERLRNLLRSAPGAALMDAVAAVQAAEREVERLKAQPLADVMVIRETGRTFGEAWAAGGIEDRRNLLLQTVGEMTVMPAQTSTRAGVRGGSVDIPSRLREYEALAHPESGGEA